MSCDGIAPLVFWTSTFKSNYCHIKSDNNKFLSLCFSPFYLVAPC